MKNSIKSIFVTMALIIVCCGVLCSCSPKFVGTWSGNAQTGEQCKLTINSDSTYVLNVGEWTYTGSWTEGDNAYYLTHDTLTIVCNMDGDALKLEGKNFLWKTATLYK